MRSWKYSAKRCKTLQWGLQHTAAPPCREFRTLVSAHHLIIGTLVHAELYAAPAIYVDKRDLLLVIYRTYILVFVVLPKPFEIFQATSFSTANSPSEQKLPKSKTAKRLTSHHTSSHHGRTMSSSAVHLDSLPIILVEHCFSQ